ncbi:A/G-specific DNA-adenine glycosylase [Roseinatronobacter thiooxidans]|uniref:Adenine DNA glycosylase n=1 Tax=Roseinatronobacter thiooxidans TaxID=121821 RepID=A0A2W7QG96_9RHOB|nr:A/G-specific adenine glycosylase [Roseinatronobacter thiooxidans]PZX47283.1 A/G-specific DNA-adenine glycosylase [Roseinatronobacter thiooxidans]
MRDECDTRISDALMAWYDRHARVLPWRVPPGSNQTPDPYRIWLSEVMLQQTTVAAVQAYFHRFTARWPTVQDLAAAQDDEVMAEWAGLGYYARARNLLKCAREVSRMGGFPRTREALQTLPGIGPYTSAAIAAIAFDQQETVLDGNVERVMARLFDEHTPLPQAKPILTGYAASLTPPHRPGDHAQAVMDLGATICTPRNPACGICPVMAKCAARLAGTAPSLPRKTRKPAKPVRMGIAYLGRRADGAWLMERRPLHGLLGGMLGWPGSEWAEMAPTDTPPVTAQWRAVPEEVRHTFTHFHLRLSLRVAELPMSADGMFIAAHEFRPAALPTVMRKAHALAAAHLNISEVS